MMLSENQASHCRSHVSDTVTGCSLVDTKLLQRLHLKLAKLI